MGFCSISNDARFGDDDYSVTHSLILVYFLLSTTLMFSILVLVLGAQPSIPMPFPLPVNFSFGVCGTSPVGMPSCSASMAFVASKTNPLSTNCAHTSALQPLKCAPVHSCNTQIYVSNVDLFTPRSLPMNHPLSLLTPFLCTFDVSLHKTTMYI